MTIKRDNVGDYYLILTCDNYEAPENLRLTGNRVGIDFGLNTFLTLSDEIKIKSPEFYKKSLKAIRSAHKALSRKQYLSHGWYKAKRHLCRVYKKIANQRRDWFFKLALRLVRKYDRIAIESLNLDAMKRLWGRKVSDYAFGEFSLILNYACDKYGKVLAKADKWQPTTKSCHHCGHRNPDIQLKDRYWTCQACHTHHDRDINAAINILQAGKERVWLFSPA